MLLNKVKDLVLALNIQGINIMLTIETQYSNKFKNLYYSYRLTVWEKYIKDHKAKHRPVFNKRYSKVSDMVLLLSEVVKRDDKKAYFIELSRSEYFEKNPKRDRANDSKVDS